MSCNTGNAKPGYPAYLPPSYQILGPEQDQSLDLILVNVPDAQVAAPTNPVQFWVRTPDVRCRTRVTILLEPDGVTINPQAQANTVILGGTAQLWVEENERSRGGTAQPSPVRNVVGTAAAPLAVPTDTRLWGFVFELETAGQELYGQFKPPATVADPAAGSKWHLVVRYASVVPVSIEEWNQFLGKRLIRCAPEAGIDQG